MKELRTEARERKVQAGLLRRLWMKIADLFEPEEVEVTFKQEGGKIVYTYTKVVHHKVA